MEDITKEFQGNFGFGCMRLPMKDGQVDTNEFSRMIDAYLNAGFCYFDTAHGYLEGKVKQRCGNVWYSATPETGTF